MSAISIGEVAQRVVGRTGTIKQEIEADGGLTMRRDAVAGQAGNPAYSSRFKQFKQLHDEHQ